MKRTFFRVSLSLITAISLSNCQLDIFTSPEISQLNQLTTLHNAIQKSFTTASKKVSSEKNGAIYIPDVPFIEQGNDNTCAQAVMTMLLQYWGKDIDYQTLKDENNPFNIATSYDAVLNYVTQKDMSIKALKNGTLANLILEVHRGHPIMTLLDFGGLTQAHYVLVVGYNPRHNTIIFHESKTAPYIEIEADRFLDMWKNSPIVNLPIFGGSNYFRLMFEVKKP